jgi:uncharacterized protein YjiS (DUF1127 family)
MNWRPQPIAPATLCQTVFPRPENKRAATIFFATVIRARAATAWCVVAEWARRRRSRRELQLLSRREILDFCPKLTDAMREAEKPFWCK